MLKLKHGTHIRMRRQMYCDWPTLRSGYRSNSGACDLNGFDCSDTKCLWTHSRHAATVRFFCCCTERRRRDYQHSIQFQTILAKLNETFPFCPEVKIYSSLYENPSETWMQRGLNRIGDRTVLVLFIHICVAYLKSMPTTSRC